MLQFKLKERDDKTKVRTGVLKSKYSSSLTPQRTLTSTELNYRNEIKEVCANLKYPHKTFISQIRIDAKSLWMRDNNYYSSLLKQVQRYLPHVVDKNCILKPVLGVKIRERQEDGTYKMKFKPLHKLNLNLSDDKIKLIIKTTTQLTFDADYDGLALPYIFPLLKLNLWNKNLKIAQNFALNELSSGLEIMPQLPHSDNVDDFEKAMKDYYDANQSGMIGIPFSSTRLYRFTHNAVKKFSEKDYSEEIGIVCLDAPRKHPFRRVAHPHYSLLQGYDFIVRKMPYFSFLREGGKGAHQINLDKIKQFETSSLAINKFNKKLLFDTNPINTTCPFFKDFDNKTLFRKALNGGYLDTLTKVLESFDSSSEMNECQPYIMTRDFNSYMRIRESLNNAYRNEFSQTGLKSFT